MLRGRFTKCVRQLKALYWPEIQLQLDAFLFPKYCALKAQLLQTHMKYKAEKNTRAHSFMSQNRNCACLVNPSSSLFKL